MVTFGVEEEYCFIDSDTLQPRDVSPAVYRALRVERVESKNVQREFLLSQLERPSPVFETLQQALGDLQAFRGRLREAAASVGVVPCASGTFPSLDGGSVVTDKPRYHRVYEEYGQVGRDYYFNGLHVHVHIDDRESGVRALNGLRRWMPLLTALGANSPFWNGADTGFASWRTIQLQRWTTRGTPPRFADSADYDRRIERLVGVGGTFDDALVMWNIRLSNHLPTIEIRTPDVQLEAWHTVLLAALTRALVATALAGEGEAEELDAELIDAALWLSARDGIADQLVHPLTGGVVPAREAVDALVDHVRGALEEAGDLALVEEWVDRIFEEGTGAARQLDAYERGGRPSLAALYRNSIAPEPAHPTSTVSDAGSSSR
ncbi:YbdK family carboxylate-amine ligase [Salinibacterium sp. dk2585]|uniref:carboxylate-amine ligase n=1 Tax=unclassified Salinibacterium TaxID=2632331 RepID=UPI0011C24B0C|nr:MULTISPECIES: YbdK family carboxylate-amine ligase [unclassified Salinibacterium]QEE62419.1 YbdK family carboxylate-amine ligase [Salinibacterium sp. dk2585]TXK52698.1 YbdK family carboxylate-amine ligase [Salinibacterium sp. dk5596]